MQGGGVLGCRMVLSSVTKAHMSLSHKSTISLDRPQPSLGSVSATSKHMFLARFQWQAHLFRGHARGRGWGSSLQQLWFSFSLPGESGHKVGSHLQSIGATVGSADASRLCGLQEMMEYTEDA